VSNARLLRPPRIGIFLRSFPLHMRWLCAENDRRKLLDPGRPRYGDHYSHRLQYVSEKIRQSPRSQRPCIHTHDPDFRLNQQIALGRAVDTL
jgi:hypothetical protein